MKDLDEKESYMENKGFIDPKKVKFNDDVTNPMTKEGIEELKKEARKELSKPDWVTWEKSKFVNKVEEEWSVGRYCKEDFMEWLEKYVIKSYHQGRQEALEEAAEIVVSKKGDDDAYPLWNDTLEIIADTILALKPKE